MLIIYISANVCTPNPCQNFGLCIPTSSSTALCLCPSNYTGFLCEFEDPCASNPCLNGAKCRTLNLFGSKPQYRCSCSVGYGGNNCQTNLNTTCTSSTCYNGGTCFIDSNSRLTKCSCLPLFTGTF